MTTRSLRSMGRPVNQRINSPPGQKFVLEPPALSVGFAGEIFWLSQENMRPQNVTWFTFA